MWFDFLRDSCMDGLLDTVSKAASQPGNATYAANLRSARITIELGTLFKLLDVLSNTPVRVSDQLNAHITAISASRFLDACLGMLLNWRTYEKVCKPTLTERWVMLLLHVSCVEHSNCILHRIS